MTRAHLPWLLFGLVAALMFVLGFRLPVGDAAIALLAGVVAGVIHRSVTR